MRKKMYWGLASLILIIGVVGVYFMLQPDPEPEKKFIAPSEADIEKVREAKQPPREAKDGFTWEWHADHWHEVPIGQNEQVKQSEQNEPEQVFKPESTQSQPDGWKLPIPEGSDPRDIDLEAIHALRKKVFSNLTNSEIHQLKVDTLNLLPSERKLIEFARYAEIFSRNPDQAEAWRKVIERQEKARTLWRERNGR